MANYLKTLTPFLAIILSLLVAGYTFAQNKVVVIPMGGSAAQQLITQYASGEQTMSVDATGATVRQLTFSVPSNGMVIVNSTVEVAESTEGDAVMCSITNGTEIDSTHIQSWQSGGLNSGGISQLSGTRGFNVTNTNYTFRLVCSHSGSSGSSNVYDSSLTALFVPSS